MSNLLNNVQILDEIIRDLEKINAKLENGHTIFAWRDNRRLLSKIEQIRKATILESEETQDPQSEFITNEE